MGKKNKGVSKPKMALEGVQLDLEAFPCSICLDLLKDPVTTSCGHNYCMMCIKTHWDGEDQRGIYSCPQCRTSFKPRPVLLKNTMLAGLVEQLKKTGLQAAPADFCYAGPEDASCDVCSGRKLKAIKSCLVCLASYCEKHLQPHYDSASFQKHKLMDPSKKLQENICSAHDEVMKMFCRTDQKCICYLCSVEEHKGHDTVSAAAEIAEKQRELQVRRETIQQEIQDREKHVKYIQRQVEAINHSADKTVEDSEEIFTQLIRLIQKRSSDVTQRIRSKQETELSEAKELQEKLEQEMTELKRKDAELKQLSLTEDHNQFLLNYPSVLLSESPDSCSTMSSYIHMYLENVTEAVEELRDNILDVLRDTWTNTPLTVSEVEGLLPGPEPEPNSRAGFLKYSCNITLDPNTAHRLMSLSEENRKADLSDSKPSYPDHPDRFTVWWRQVLSRESLADHCYWEVELKAPCVSVAVAYKNISRTRKSCRFGMNRKSWALWFYKNSFTFWHNNIETSISAPGYPSMRIGVYLDHRAGVLSFYRVTKTMTLLHRVQTTFTQPLHTGVCLYYLGNSAEFCKLR